MLYSERIAPPDGVADVHLSMRTRQGSFQHYHHFLLGFLVPLVAMWDEVVAGHPRRVFVRSCALMDPLLLQLDLPGLTILPVEVHDAMRGTSSVPPCREMVVQGYDWPDRYDGRIFASVKQKLFHVFNNALLEEHGRLARRFSGDGDRILMIRRLPPDPFYSSVASEAKTAGAQRRSVANFDALTKIVESNTNNLLVGALDGFSLIEQMARFAWADLVIAQHGAALSNLLWARPGTRVIEIVPRESETPLRRDDFFGALASCLDLKLQKIWQALPHGPVDPEDVRRALSGTSRA